MHKGGSGRDIQFHAPPQAARRSTISKLQSYRWICHARHGLRRLTQQNGMAIYRGSRRGWVLRLPYAAHQPNAAPHDTDRLTNYCSSRRIGRGVGRRKRVLDLVNRRGIAWKHLRASYAGAQVFVHQKQKQMPRQGGHGPDCRGVKINLTWSRNLELNGDSLRLGSDRRLLKQ